MERRLVKHGPSSTIIALPAQWIRDQGLRPGDSVEVVPDGDKILVTKRRAENAAEVTIDATGLNRTSLFHLIRAAYRDGAHRIHVRFDSKSIQHYRAGVEVPTVIAIREEINRLLGLEIVDQSVGRLTIQEITSPSGQEVPNLFRKVFTMTRLLIGQMGSASPDEDIGVEERHDTITKLVSYAVRLINTGEAGLPGAARMRLLHSFMLIDIIVDTLKYYRREHEPHRSEFTEELVALFSDVERIVFAHDRKALDSFEERKVRLRAKPIDRLLPITDVLTDIVLIHASEFVTLEPTVSK